MAAVEITISGVLYDKVNRTSQNVVLIGEATLTGLGVGGGPMPPGGGTGIWGPTDPRPTPPIYLPPGYPGSPPSGAHPEHPIYWPPGTQPHPEHPIALPPPTVWPPGPGIDVPSHPIVIPPPVDPDKPPEIPPGLITWKPVWTPDTGWVVIGFPNVPHPSPAKK